MRAQVARKKKDRKYIRMTRMMKKIKEEKKEGYMLGKREGRRSDEKY